jgi:hypothetical protein
VSQVEVAIEKVKRLDAEIERGLTQLKNRDKISGDQVYAEIRERNRERRGGDDG